GYIFTRTIIEDVLAIRPGWRFYIVCPVGMTFSHPNVTPIQPRYALTKYQARFEFDWRELTLLLERTRPTKIDLLWVNQAEQAGNVTALVRNLERRSVPVFTYFHYPCVVGVSEAGPSYDPSLNDWSLGALIHLRQYEALVCSDLAAVGSQFARELLLTSFKQLFLSVPEDRLITIPPPVDFDHVGEVTLPNRDPPTILYNHRLYEHYGTEQLINWIEHFKNTFSHSFKLLVTDPLVGRSSEQERLDSSVSKGRIRLRKLPYAQVVTPRNRSHYIELVRSATVGLAPFREAPPWSMAAIDVMACGRPLLAPVTGPFPEILARRSSLLFHDKDDFCDKLSRLLTSKDTWLEDAQYCLSQSARFHRKELGKRYARLFEGVVSGLQHRGVNDG
ncbi:MAG TPA: glycosyltransferase, partial [Pyrinomonadaceae bacterium]|nr:glycosyltransferase [Pyrinomonadaceae bacterium]